MEAYQKIENAQLDLQQQSIDFESMISTMPKSGEMKLLSVEVEEHSKHLSATAWALGINVTGMSYKEAGLSFINNQSKVANLRSQIQTTTEKLDEKITSILKTNNIVLDDKETLNLTVNEKGEITVGKGISENKRTVLEKLLNEDKTLGQDLLFSHAQRQVADIALTPPSDENTRQILADSLLQREFGISLSDLELAHPEKTNEVGLTVRSKDGQYDKILETLHDEELATFIFIENALNDRTETAAEKGTAGFEYSYSYKNGITVEKSVTDQAGINKMSDRFLNREVSLVTLFGEDAVDYSVTIDSAGTILDSKINAVKGNTDKSVLAELNRRWTNYIASAPANEDDYFRNPFLSEITLQQFAFDIQRLYRFNTGVSKEQAQSMKITFGSSI
ncbi:MAG: hypothetical protein LBC20_09050 [Planctomycetaceae bacterium]|nr:hypothetical protein [Planctomycetaceae bacterium]